MELINNIQNIVFENSENLKNDTYINLQNELMKLHKELKDANLNITAGLDIKDGFWACMYCMYKKKYENMNVFFTYVEYGWRTSNLLKHNYCDGCYNSTRTLILIKTNYQISGIPFCMRGKVYLRNNIPGLDVKYQYMNRKHMDLYVLLGLSPCKGRLEDIQEHFGIEIIDTFGRIIQPSEKEQKYNDIIFGMLLKFQQEYSFFEDDCYKEKVTLKYTKIKKKVVITKK